MNFQMGAGCTYCNLTGYRGRAAIYELLEIDRAARRRDPARRFDRSSPSIVRQREGFTTLADAALELVAQRHDQRRRSHERHQRSRRQRTGGAEDEAVSQDEHRFAAAAKPCRLSACPDARLQLHRTRARRRAVERPHGRRLADGSRRAPARQRHHADRDHAGEGRGARATSARLLRKLGIGKPKTSDLVMFSRQMYTITKSGIPLLRGIKGLAASTHNVVLRETLEEILRDLEGGRDLAGSLARHPNDLSAALRQHHPRRRRDRHAGGVVPAASPSTCSRTRTCRTASRRRLRYPIIVMCVIAVAIGVLTMFVIPKFEPLFKQLGDNIPWPTLRHHGRLVLRAEVLVRRPRRGRCSRCSASAATCAPRRDASAGTASSCACR